MDFENNRVAATSAFQLQRESCPFVARCEVRDEAHFASNNPPLVRCRSRVPISTSVALTIIIALLANAATAQQNRVEISVEDGYRYIRANGIPDHPTGRFPNQSNPNAIAPQEYAFRVPAAPMSANRMTPVGLRPFGVAINGVPFDPNAAEFWGRDPEFGWQFEALGPAVDLGLDHNNGHVQPGGAYHYHGMPWALVQMLNTSYGMVLIGYAADGFPIYALHGHEKPNDPRSPLVKVRSSYRLRAGMRDDGPGGRFDGSFVQDYEFVNGAGDLDGCNGRFGVTPQYPGGIYHYFVTEDFPFIPRFYRGRPDQSFERRGPPGGPIGPERGPRHRGPPPPGAGPLPPPPR
jgi:hypothetical protein